MSTPAARTRNPRRTLILAAAAVDLLAAIIYRQPVIVIAPAVVGVIIAGMVVCGRVARYRTGGRAAARRRRRHQGWAGPVEVARARRAATRLGRRISPATSLLVLGTSRRQPVAVHRENSALYVGPPGYWKTSALACHAADAPGPLLATSTKTELLLDTLPYRTGKGRIWILNADGYGNIPTTLAWSPLEGCVSAQVAIRRAGDFTQACAKGDPKGDGEYWAGKAADLLAALFHLAAVTGATMRDVTMWAAAPWLPTVKAACSHPAADQALATEIASLLSSGDQHLNSVIHAARAALAWMKDPVMAAAACPRPGEGFSAWEFAGSDDSVYLIGEKRPYGSLAPYFAALAAECFEQLKGYAQESPSGRLPVPATFVLDEMPLTCPMAVHGMLAHARGYLITITAGIQSLSQLRATWGEHDGNTIRSACPVEVFTGGEKRHDDLKAVSDVIGDHDTWTTRPDDVRGEPLLPPGALRMLRKGRAVILMPECRPVLASLPAIWKRRGHQRATLADLPARLPSPQLAIEPPRPRGAIVTPYQPAVTKPDPVPALTEEVTGWPNIPAVR